MSVPAEAMYFQSNRGPIESQINGQERQLELSNGRLDVEVRRSISSFSWFPRFQLRSDGRVLPPRRGYLIDNLNRSDLVLNSQIPIYVESAGDEFVAYSSDLEEFAVGSDEQSAIDELKASIAATYFILKEDQLRLGPIQKNHWYYIKRIVSET